MPPFGVFIRAANTESRHPKFFIFFSKFYETRAYIDCLLVEKMIEPAFESVHENFFPGHMLLRAGRARVEGPDILLKFF